MSSLSSFARKLFRRRDRRDRGFGGGSSAAADNNNINNNTTSNHQPSRRRRTKKAVLDNKSSSSSSMLLLDESYEKLILHINIDGNQRGQLIQLYKNLKKIQTGAATLMIETYKTHVSKLQISLEFVHLLQNHQQQQQKRSSKKNHHHPRKLLSSKQMKTLCQIIQLVLSWIPNIEEICFEKTTKEDEKDPVQPQQQQQQQQDNDKGDGDINMDDLAYLCSSAAYQDDYVDDDDDDDDDENYHHHTKQMIVPFPIIRTIFEEDAVAAAGGGGDGDDDNQIIHLQHLKRLIFRYVSIPDYYAYHHPHGNEDIHITSLAPYENLDYLELNHCWWINDVYSSTIMDDSTTTTIEQYWPNFVTLGGGGCSDASSLSVKHIKLVTNYYRGGLLDDGNNNNRTNHNHHHHRRRTSLKTLLEQQQPCTTVETNSNQHQQMVMRTSSSPPPPSSSSSSSMLLQVLNLDGFTLDYLDSAELFRTLLNSSSSSSSSLQQLSCCVGLSQRTTGRFSPTRQTLLQLIKNHRSIQKIKLTVIDLDSTLSETNIDDPWSGIHFLSKDIPEALLVNKQNHHIRQLTTTAADGGGGGGGGGISNQLLELCFQRNPNCINNTPLIIPLKLQIDWLNVVTHGHKYNHHYFTNEGISNDIDNGNNNNTITTTRQQKQHNEKEEDEEEQATIHECYLSATGLEMLGIVGNQIQYENPSIQSITEFWFDLHKLNRKRLLNNHSDDSGIIPKEIIVEAMSHVTNNVPILYFLIQLNPASLCSIDTPRSKTTG